jgi:tripartite-type tricarboxylate transporter receptor subunit TctC
MDILRVLRPLVAGAMLLTGGAAWAQSADDYPTGPVTMIVPFAPGGASDFAARLLQPKLSELLGQQVVIENREGASGNIGMDLASRAKPDGYTLFFGNVGTVSVNPYVFSSLRVKPDQDFVPISVVADAPGVLVANPEFPPNNVAELVDYAKANPGQVNFASAGAASINRLEMESFRNQAGLDMVHVPYKGGAGPAIADIIGGHVSMMFTSIGSVINHIKDGNLKALAVTTRERIPALPDVPTMAEQGFAKNVSSSWQGVLAPAGTPQPIIDKVHAAIVEAMKDQTIRDRMAESGVAAVSSASPEEFKQFLAQDAAKWKGVIETVGVTAE